MPCNSEYYKMLPGRLGIISIIMTVLLLSPGILSGEIYYDESLRNHVNEDDVWHYQARENRSEGRYIQKVSIGSPIFIVSFTKIFENYSFKGTPLKVECDPPHKAKIRIRAISLKRNLGYQMDHIMNLIIEPSTPYLWNLDVLEGLKLEKNHIGILAWSSENILKSPTDIYYPLSIKQNDSYNEKKHVIVLFTHTKISRFIAKLFRLTKTKELVMVKNAFNDTIRNSYRPRKRIMLEIPENLGPGYYKIQVFITLGNNTEPNYEYWVYLDE